MQIQSYAWASVSLYRLFWPNNPGNAAHIRSGSNKCVRISRYFFVIGVDRTPRLAVYFRSRSDAFLRLPLLFADS